MVICNKDSKFHSILFSGIGVKPLGLKRYIYLMIRFVLIQRIRYIFTTHWFSLYHFIILNQFWTDFLHVWSKGHLLFLFVQNWSTPAWLCHQRSHFVELITNLSHEELPKLMIPGTEHELNQKHGKLQCTENEKNTVIFFGTVKFHFTPKTPHMESSQNLKWEVHKANM